MKFSRLCLAVVVSLQCMVASAATGKVVAVIQDGSEFRAEFTDAGTVLRVTRGGEDLACNNAYRFYTSEGTVGADGVETEGLLLDTVVQNWVPFIQTGLFTTKKLVQTSVDPVLNVPVYDVALQVPALADMEKVRLSITNKPANPPTQAAGVQSFWVYERGGEGSRLCVQRKIYNALHLRQSGAHAFLLFARKEFLKPCQDGAYAVNEFEVVFTRETALSLGHIFATPEGDFGTKPPILGHVLTGDFLAEWGSQLLTGSFNTGAGTGDRWIEHFQGLGPGGLLLQPIGCKCTSHMTGACWLFQFELLPPGDPGDPGCECGCNCCCCQEEEPPAATPTFCPKPCLYWKSAEWPLESIVIGDEAYTKAEALVILSLPSGSDASVNLAQQVIIAKLNRAAGAEADVVGGLLQTADVLLSPQTGDLPYAVSPGSATGQHMLLIALFLDAYNKGQLTQCAEE